jgi:flagellar L-ring protein FlgH
MLITTCKQLADQFQLIRIAGVVSLLALQLLSFGCVMGGTRPDPDYAAVRPAEPVSSTLPDGTIYRAGFGLRLFEDNRAREVGDILIVILMESTDAQKSASTDASKQSNLAVSNPTLFGTPVNLGNSGISNLQFGADSTQDFKGSGSSSQSNSLNGSIGVVVSEVLSNGNLVVRGEKIIALNQGDEHVRLSGIVRAQDISPDNTVLSTQVANANISYGGKGTVNAANVLGFLSKFFFLFLPF